MSSPLVNFLADPKLVEALRAQACRSGATVSAIIREALRERVSLQ